MSNDGLADLHDSRSSRAQTLETMSEWAINAVQATDAGIFMLRAKNKVETVGSSSSQVAQAHERQLELGEGPCLEVLRDDEVNTYIIGETAADPRFPRWGPAAAELGFHSVISAVLETRKRRLGSLNVYSSQPHAFDRDDLAVIEIFARRAAMALEVSEENVGLNTALDTRKLIGQAQGILMERFGIDGDRAFEYLVRQSQAKNLKLRAISEWIVANRDGKTLDELGL